MNATPELSVSLLTPPLQQRWLVSVGARSVLGFTQMA